MDNLYIEGVNVGEAFKNMKVGEEIVLDLEKVRDFSVNVLSVERKTKQREVNVDVLKKIISGVLLVSVITVASFGLDKAIEFNSPLKMENMSKEIYAVIRQVEDFKPHTILGQNTRRNGDVVFYDQEGIAKDLLSLDSSLFDYALCSVCNEMGNNLNNNVGINGLSNIDAVIYYLRFYSNMEGKYFNQYVSSAFRDVDSLNGYLIKNGYVDSNGNPSMEMFKKASDSNAQVIYDIIKAQSKGASLS